MRYLHRERLKALRDIRDATRRMRKDGDIFSAPNVRAFRRVGTVLQRDFERMGRVGARSFARNSVKFLMHEFRGLARNLPGSRTFRRILGFRGPLLGTLLAKTIMGPLDILKAPFEATRFIRGYLPGLALLVGVPVLIRQAINAAGAALAAFPPILLGAFAVMQKGITDLARTTGRTVEELRQAAQIGDIFGGTKSRDQMLKFSDTFDKVAGGNLKKKKSGDLTTASEEQKKHIEFLKLFYRNDQGGKSVYDEFKAKKGLDARSEIIADALARLRSGNAYDAKGKLIGKDKADGFSRQIAKYIGPQAAKEYLRYADEANRRGITVPDFFKEIRGQKGILAPETLTGIQRITHAIDKLFRVMQGTGVGFANNRLGVVAKWLEDFAEGLDETKLARIEALTKIFDVNAKGISKFFADFANPPVGWQYDEMGQARKGFLNQDGTFSAEDPRLKFVRETGDFLAKWANQAKEFMGTLSGIWELIQKIHDSAAGGHLMNYAKTMGGLIGGTMRGLVEAIDMKGAKPSDRLRKLIYNMLKGAGVQTTEDLAMKRLGGLTDEFFSWQFKRLNNYLKDAGGFTKLGTDFAQGFAKGAMGPGGLHEQIGKLMPSIMEGIKGMSFSLFDALFNKDGLRLATAYGADLAMNIVKGMLGITAFEKKANVLGAFLAKIMGFDANKLIANTNQSTSPRLDAVRKQLEEERAAREGRRKADQLKFLQRENQAQLGGSTPGSYHAAQREGMGVTVQSMVERQASAAELQYKAGQAQIQAAAALNSAVGRLLDMNVGAASALTVRPGPTGRQTPGAAAGSPAP